MKRLNSLRRITADVFHLIDKNIKNLTEAIEESRLNGQTKGWCRHIYLLSGWWLVSNTAFKDTNYQQVLRTVTYNILSENPDTTVRTVSFVANDGVDNSNLAVAAIMITPQNDPPTATEYNAIWDSKTDDEVEFLSRMKYCI